MRNFLLSLLFLLTLCSYTFGQSSPESLKIVWPEEYKWKVGVNQSDSLSHTIVLVPEKESMEHWTIMGQMVSYKGVTVPDLDLILKSFAEAALQESPKAKFSVLESDNTSQHFYTLFKIETPSFPGDSIPESQLYYVVQGDDALYVNFVAVKEKKLSKNFISRWTSVFKSSELVHN